MKLIDLLVKIANGEEVPKLIEYKGARYVFQNNKYVGWNDLLKIDFENLNDEIEIIEDKPKKIKKMAISDYKEVFNQYQLDVISHINLIIDRLDYLLEKSDKE